MTFDLHVTIALSYIVRVVQINEYGVLQPD